MTPPWVGHTESLPLGNVTKLFDDRSISSFTHNVVGISLQLRLELTSEAIQNLRLRLLVETVWMVDKPGLYLANSRHRKRDIYP
jgi:hypothetical protein